MDRVKSMKGHRLKVHHIPFEELDMYVWVDAGSQNRHDGSSTQGIVLGIASKRMSHGDCVPVSLAAWHSQKIERRCRSPGAAEALAAINGEDTLYYGRFQLAEMMGVPVDVRNVDATVNYIDGSLVTDSRNVYDKMETETLNIRGAEKRTDLELVALKSAQWRNYVKIRWVHGEAQLANGLTKSNEYKQLELFYGMGQCWRMVEDPERASARRRKAAGLGPLESRAATQEELLGNKVLTPSWPGCFLVVFGCLLFWGLSGSFQRCFHLMNLLEHINLGRWDRWTFHVILRDKTSSLPWKLGFKLKKARELAPERKALCPFRVVSPLLQQP